jgi:hypothetical protein
VTGKFSSYLTENTLSLQKEINRLMLLGEKRCFENYTEHTDTLCGQNAEF